MNYWWVNHRQTFKHEFGGKYIWCPKRDKSGNRQFGWETVREVVNGDLIFSYAHQQLRGFGFVTSPSAYSFPRPPEFEKAGHAWEKRGWRADVNFTRFQQPLRPKDHISLIAPLLPQKYSPIQSSGDGNQNYLTQISESLALVLAELASHELAMNLKKEISRETPKENSLEYPLIFNWEEEEQKAIESAEGITETTRKALVQARVGQGKFKQRVSGYERACRITKVDNPTHLIASHIKPWRESDNDERLTGGNGLLLTPSIDHLFDRGFISFEDNGDLITSPIADERSLERMGVRDTNVGRFNIDQKYFLDYHRKEILLKSAS